MRRQRTSSQDSPGRGGGGGMGPLGGFQQHNQPTAFLMNTRRPRRTNIITGEEINDDNERNPPEPSQSIIGGGRYQQQPQNQQRPPPQRMAMGPSPSFQHQHQQQQANANNLLADGGTATTFQTSATGSGVSQSNDPAALISSLRAIQLLTEVQAQLSELRRRQQEIVQNMEASFRKLQLSQEALQRRLDNAEQGLGNRERDMGEQRRQMASAETQSRRLTQEIEALKAALGKQAADFVALRNDLKNQSIADITKFSQSSQYLENRFRDLLNQFQQMKQALDRDLVERARNENLRTESITKLRELIRQQDASKSESLAGVAKRAELERERLGGELRLVQERLQATTAELNKALQEREQRAKEELALRYAAIEEELKSHMEGMDTFKNALKRKNEERWQAQSKFVEELRSIYQEDKAKYRERFLKFNEALVALEQHLEIGSQKVDKLIGTEIESRKLHEKNLLRKINDVETRLNDYLAGLTKTVNDVKVGVASIKIPALDVDALRRDMEAIAADKSKLTMEGLLKLEERITRIQHAVSRDRRTLNASLLGMVDAEVEEKLRGQIEKLDDLMDDIERAQVQIRDKVERQIPNDVGELSAKVDNVRAQLMERISEEEEERYQAIKELQEAYGQLAASSVGGGPATSSTTAIGWNSGMKRELEECKISIKKLAESLTTVKNVLDRKILDEVRRREKDIDVLNSRMDSTLISIQTLQQIH